MRGKTPPHSLTHSSIFFATCVCKEGHCRRSKLLSYPSSNSAIIRGGRHTLPSRGIQWGYQSYVLTSVNFVQEACSTEPGIMACTWLREISSRSCLTVWLGPAWLLLNKICSPLFWALYRDRLKGVQILLSNSQAGPGRKIKQGQEEISRNHVQAIFPGSVHQT